MPKKDGGLVFYPRKSDRLEGKNKTSFHVTVILFYSLILFSLGVLIYTIVVAGASVFGNFMYPFFYPLLAAATLYATNKPPIPFLSKKEKLENLQYHLNEKELHIILSGKIKMSVPYKSIFYAEKLPEPIGKPGSVQSQGKFLWIADQAIGVDDYGALYVFSSSLSEGVLLHRKFEKILVSPEKDEEFMAEIKRRAKVEESNKKAASLMKNIR
ncbi:PH domain-containing protein [Evansella clarkii]|jgi:hypothetical protein|uniref:PH domain-containing protein n=1 Tax=Evansella clarkii TaxID=79879 RepID=UPI0009971020|nr:PH domain-containing protein [Evansella clarkii]